MTYRIGIVGAGDLTRQSLVPALDHVPGLTLAAVLDVSDDALEAVGHQARGAVLTTDEDRFFAASLDAVHVATPNHLHERFACRALERGLVTLVEKPLAHTVDSGQRILAAASRAPALMGYMAKHNVYNREVRRLVAAGAIGAPLAMTAARLGGWRDGWRSRAQESGLGCLGDLGTYPVITAVDLFGTEAVRCQAAVWPVHDPEHLAVYAQATVWFGRHRYLHFETAAMPTSDDVSTYTVVGESGIIQVKGSWQMNGSGSLDLYDGAGWRSVPLTPVDPYVSQYRLLASCCAGAPVPPEVSVHRALRDLTILYAVTDNAAAASGITDIRPGTSMQPVPVSLE